MKMNAGWYNILLFLMLVHFSLSIKQTGVRKQLNRHSSRLKAIEARQVVDGDKLSEQAERISMLESMIESILNDTKSTSVTEVENRESEQKLSSDVTSECSDTCYEYSIGIILNAFNQEKVLNAHLREEISDLKVIVRGVNKNVTQAVDEISDLKVIVNGVVIGVDTDRMQTLENLQAIRNSIEAAEELHEHQEEVLSQLTIDLDSFNSSIVYPTKQMKDESLARPASCKQAFDHKSRDSGVYTVYPEKHGVPVRVFCDMETDGGGWTVFQRRKDGSEDFERDWQSYELGFGKLGGEFWLGNKHISEMTERCCYDLRIDMEDFEGISSYAKYENFQVLSKDHNYMLQLGTYSGNAEDALENHSGMAFSTTDRDNDQNLSGNCAKGYMSGWWFNRCMTSNLNGHYLNGKTLSSYGIIWDFWKSDKKNSLKMTEMKFRKIGT